MSLILGTIVAVSAGRKLAGSGETYLLGIDALSADLTKLPDLRPFARSFGTSVLAGLVVVAIAA